MLTITARFLHGTIRAGSPDDTVMAGGEPSGEWPPSPARVFAALVAADGTRDRCRVTDGTELEALEALGPPRVHADRNEDVATTIIPARFVVRDESAQGISQNYPARTNVEVRPGVKSSPRTPQVSYVWDGQLDDAALEGLRRRAARVGYLGCSDSPVQLSVSIGGPPADLAEWRPGVRRGLTLPVPYPGFTTALDAAHDAWSRGEAMRRSWVPTRRERYGIAHGEKDSTPDNQPVVVWLEFDRRIAGRRALTVSCALRDALLDHCDSLLDKAEGSSGRRAPWQLHGHDIPHEVERPYQLVRYLPLANVGHPHSDGAIHGAAVWLPPGTPPELIELVRALTFGQLRRLRAVGLDTGVMVRTGERGRWSTRPERWMGPARRWFSATPAVAERGRRGGPSHDDVRTWFRNAGHPVPRRVRVSPVPTAPGVPRLHAREVHRPDKDRHPFYWLEVAFDHEVTGPLCVGRSRSLGMGLLAPGPEHNGAMAEPKA